MSVKCPDLPSAIRLARNQIKKDDPDRVAKLELLKRCERVARTGGDPYWVTRLDKALANGDFVAVRQYLAKLE